MMATFVIQKTGHASRATTLLTVLLETVSLLGVISGHWMVISRQCCGPNCSPTNLSTLCACNEDQTQGAYRTGMEWTQSWARNCQATWKPWVKPSSCTISSKPRAWKIPEHNSLEYTIAPLTLHCVHNSSLPRIQMAASLLNSCLPRSPIAPAGSVWLCGTC